MGFEYLQMDWQLSIKFFLLINVILPTFVGILTFISMINTTSERFKARNSLFCWYFSFYEQLKFHAQLSMKKSFIISGPGLSLPSFKVSGLVENYKIYMGIAQDSGTYHIREQHRSRQACTYEQSHQS